jgi:prophage DNA circulation protein
MVNPISVIEAALSLIDPFADALKKCHFRGYEIVAPEIKFAPEEAIVLHEYPYKKYPNPENMQSPRDYYEVQGFIQSTNPSYPANVYGSFEKQVYKAFRGQTGIFTHPSQGDIMVTCLRCSTGISADYLGAISVSLRFVAVDPNSTTINAPKPNTPFSLQNFVSSGLSSISTEFSSAANGFLQSGIGIAVGAALTAVSFIGAAVEVVSGATSAVGAVKGLGYITDSSVTLGRYSAGNLSQAPACLAAVDTSQPMPAQIIQGTQLLRDNYTTALANLNIQVAALANTADSLNAATLSTMSNSVQTALAAVVAATNDPIDTINALTAVANQTQVSALPGAVATGNLIAWSALAYMGNVISVYQPTSSTDADNLLTEITPIYQAAWIAAADAHDVASYKALKQIFSGISAYLRSVAVNLPPLVTYSFPTSLPAPVLAQWVYQDGSRADEIMLRANPVHPLFMPQAVVMLS